MQTQQSSSLHFLFIYGKGAAGKDTQAALLLQEDPTAIKISTGDILREAKDPSHRYHDHLSPYIVAAEQEGTLIADDVVAGVVGEEIVRLLPEGKRLFIFTGFPRTEGQLQATDEIIARMREQYSIRESHILLSVFDRHSRERAEMRKNEALALKQQPRADDERNIVDKRLGVYNLQTRPMLLRLFGEGRLQVASGKRDIPTVAENTRNMIGTEVIPMRPQERR